jgi:hypothetical protein
MRRRTLDRAREERAYLKLAERVLSQRPTCESCFERPSREVHHQAGRAGWRLLYEPWLIPLCAACHREAHAHKVIAVWRGVSLPRWAEPSMCLNHGYEHPGPAPCREPAGHDGLHEWELTTELDAVL